MPKVAIIGLEGEDGLWLADFENGTVKRLTQELKGDLASTASARQLGVSVVKGVNYAVLVSSAASVASGHHEP